MTLLDLKCFSFTEVNFLRFCENAMAFEHIDASFNVFRPVFASPKKPNKRNSYDRLSEPLSLNI